MTVKIAKIVDDIKSGSKNGGKDDGSVGEKKKNADSAMKLKRKRGVVEPPTRGNNVPSEASVQSESTNAQSEIKQKKNKKKKVEEKEENVTNSDGIENSPAVTNDLKQTPDTKTKEKKEKRKGIVAIPNTGKRLSSS